MKLIIRCACLVFVVTALVSCASPKIEWTLVDESERFTFYAAKGAEDSVPLLAKELESNYDRITTDLQVNTTEKFPIYIFADIDTFHQASGQRGASATHVGTTQGMDTWIVSPLNTGGALSTQEVLTAGVHEFTHALVNYINGSLEENNYQIPIWLNEGLAGYEAQQMIPEWRARLAELVAENQIPSIATDLVPDRFEEVKGLPFSITLVEYLVKQYGFDKIIAIIKSPSEVESILGVTISELESGWREYLHETYR
ncbi:MAG: peptidase MA family metallohydrolase [Chloroflexota bacterium]